MNHSPNELHARLKLVRVKRDRDVRGRQDAMARFHPHQEHLDRLQPSEVLSRAEEGGIGILDNVQQVQLRDYMQDAVRFCLI